MATSPFWNLSYLEGATAMPTCDQRRASQPQEPTALFRTPPEIFLAVFKLLAKDKIRRVRLVCRHWRVLGAYFLMDRVFFSPRRKTMENFTAISRHPIFSKSIKEIVYDAAINDASLLDLERYKEEYSHRYSETDEETYQRGFNQYQKVFDDQQVILATGEDFAVLKAGMDLMPNVSRIFVLDGLEYRAYRDWYDNTGPGSWDANPTLYPPSSLEHYGRPEAPWDLRIVQNVFRAISLSDTRIKSLVLGVGGWEVDKSAVPFPPTRFTGFGSEHARSAIRSLNELSVHFQPDSDCNSSLLGPYDIPLEFQKSRLEDSRSLVAWLSEAQNLTELTLEFCPALDWGGSRELLKTALFPSLQAVRLANIRCHKFPAAEFLRRHMLEVADFDIVRSGGGVEVCQDLVAFTKVHLEQLLVKSATHNCWWPSDIKLAYVSRQRQRDRFKRKGYVADALLSRALVVEGVACAVHAAACAFTLSPTVI